MVWFRAVVVTRTPRATPFDPRNARARRDPPPQVHKDIEGEDGVGAPARADDADAHEFHKFFPSFVWVVRDFALDLVDDLGDSISPDQCVIARRAASCRLLGRATPPPAASSDAPHRLWPPRARRLWPPPRTLPPLHQRRRLPLSLSRRRSVAPPRLRVVTRARAPRARPRRLLAPSPARSLTAPAPPSPVRCLRCPSLGGVITRARIVHSSRRPTTPQVPRARARAAGRLRRADDRAQPRAADDDGILHGAALLPARAADARRGAAAGDRQGECDAV